MAINVTGNLIKCCNGYMLCIDNLEYEQGFWQI